MRDWLLKRFADESGTFDSEELIEFVRTYLPRKDDWTAIKNRVIKDNERVKFLAKISADIDIRTGEVSFSLPDFGLTSKQTIIEDVVWDACKDDLVRGRETWGMIEIGYRQPDEAMKLSGKIKLTSFKSFCPYTIDLDYYKDARNEFTISEWIDVRLGAVDYNASGYKGDEEKKLTMLTRLLPFVEKRLNLIELAPKGTGKSYLFGRVSRFGWLSSGGVMSRAKMFYDISKREEKTEPASPITPKSESQPTSASAQPSSEPNPGVKAVINGKPSMWVPGFGWIEGHGNGSIGITVDGKGDINKQVGVMGGSTVGSPGDKLTGHKVGIMGGGTVAEDMYESGVKIGLMGGEEHPTGKTVTPPAELSEPEGEVIHIVLVETPEKNSTPPDCKPNTTPPSP